MIAGIGVDAVQISRMKKWADNPDLLERFFDARELLVLRERGKGITRSVASHFAAKEAFCKALGTGFSGIVLKDIMVLNQKDERPVLFAEGSALEALKASGISKVHISLTHDGDIALAFVVLEV